MYGSTGGMVYGMAYGMASAAYLLCSLECGAVHKLLLEVGGGVT